MTKFEVLPFKFTTDDIGPTDSVVVDYRVDAEGRLHKEAVRLIKGQADAATDRPLQQSRCLGEDSPTPNCQASPVP
jgi:hypothetical protein